MHSDSAKESHGGKIYVSRRRHREGGKREACVPSMRGIGVMDVLGKGCTHSNTTQGPSSVPIALPNHCPAVDEAKPIQSLGY